MWFADRLVANRLRGFFVSKLMKRTGATHLHAMELNSAGNIAARSLDRLKASEIKVISTVWGSDIFWFGRFSKHEKSLTNILKKTDLLISECSRDLNLAMKLGFKGEFKKSESLFGFSDQIIERNRVKTSERTLILVKGYESFVGRASISLKAVQILANELKNFEIHAYSTTWKSRKIIRNLNKKNDQQIKYYKKSSLTSEQMHDLFDRTRIHIGISLSDGVPASILESMVSGAFPIQSNTACSDDWLTDGRSGLLVLPEVDQVVTALSRALADDDLVDKAMSINHQIASEKLSQKTVAARILQMNVYN
jgi:glycosyltransferase involved in cell wall biosynthesis